MSLFEDTNPRALKALLAKSRNTPGWQFANTLASHDLSTVSWIRRSCATTRGLSYEAAGGSLAGDLARHGYDGTADLEADEDDTGERS